MADPRLVAERITARIRRRPAVRHLEAQGLRIGARSSLQPGVLLDTSHAWLITIGDDVTLSPNVVVLAHDASTKAVVGKTRVAPVRIGNRVFVGANSVVLPGASIEDDCIIGAGSVVHGEIAAGTVAAGNPARPIASLADFARRQRSELSSGIDFDASWTARGGITPSKKERMRAMLMTRSGFVP